MFDYPIARRDETIQDDYFGTLVKDPYRWLEDPDSDETIKYVQDQNALTTLYIDSCPVKADINSRLTQLWNYPKYSCPYRHGNKYFFYRNTGLQNHHVMCVQDSLTSEEKVFLDPNSFSDDGTMALARTRFSEDGSVLAYGVSASGSDWFTIYFRSVITGKDYSDTLKGVKFSRITWTHDNKGIFYARYPQNDLKSGSDSGLSRFQKLYYHRLGTSQSQDILCVEFPDHPNWRIAAEVSDCGCWLVVMPQHECSVNMILYCDLTKLPNGVVEGPLELHNVIDKMEGDYEYITNDGSEFIFRTSTQAPKYRLLKIDFLNPAPKNWETLIPGHAEDVLDWAAPIRNDGLVVCYIHDVKNTLKLFDLKTKCFIYQFPLDVGTIIGYSGKKKNTEIFYQLTSFMIPGVIYHCDLTKPQLKPTVYRETKIKNFNPSLYETKQVVYNAKDGTKIPMFVVYKKELVKNKTRPCLMYGYGGFNVCIQPIFCMCRLVFIQLFGGVLAIPNIRGGGEYGEPWHNMGRLHTKQNTFDDFHAASQYLVKEGYTSHDKLIIQGGSNGGLLVAACINQRPELYGAALCHVGVLDMLRFNKFTIGHAWISDYGNPDNAKDFPVLYKYSPLHNVRPPDETRAQYPATLLLTADHDDRVVPLHSFKFIATLQEAVRGNARQVNPVLIRVDTKAGHGGGRPTTKLIDENTDVFCFLVQSLGLQLCS